MAVSLSLAITQDSQSIAGNTSTVTVKATAKWTGGSWNATGQCTGSMTINGTAYSFSGMSFNTGHTTSGSQVVMTKTVTVSHNSDGTKTLSASASFVTGVSSGTISASTSKTLTTIPRKSTLSVADGTLGTEQTLSVTRQSSGFTHTITYTCGDASGTICTKSTATSISFTPPLSLASQNTTGTSVSIVYKIETFNGSTSLGSNSYTKTCTIPDSVKPSCTIAVSDAAGYFSTYGGYVQYKSKVKVVVSATTSYGSEIASYLVKVGNSVYSGSTVTSDAIQDSGTVTVSATVTDKRGRSYTVSTTITVLAYNAPQVSLMKVARCDSDGTANDQGAYCKVTFSGSVTSLDSKNTASWAVKYKKKSASSYTSATASSSLSVSNATYKFAADTESSYDVVLTVTDKFGSSTVATTLSTGYTIMDFNADGKSIAFGKASEMPGGKAEFGIPLILCDVDGNGTNIDLWEALTTTNNNLFKTLWLNMHPVGSVYIEITGKNPGDVYGGTWEAFGAGRALVGVDSSDTDFASAETTGGEKTHKLTISEMPSHNHAQNGWATSTTSGSGSGYLYYGQTGTVGTRTTGNTGGEGAHNNLQPYITVYMWKRTA